MWKLVRLLNLRHLRGQALRTLLAMLGVVMGVATFTFAPALGANIQESLNVTTDDIAGNATVEIRAVNGGFPAELLSTVQALPEVAKAAPLVTGGGLALGQAELLVFLGIDPALDRDIRSYTLADGAFIGAAGEILLTQRYAAEKQIVIGDTITLISTGGVLPLQVVGLLDEAGGVARLNSGDLIVMGLEDAYALRGGEKLDAIAIVPAANVAPADVIARITPLLDAQTAVAGSPAERVQSAQGFMIVLQGILLTVCLMILIAGSSLIYNSVAVSIAQRRAEIGILRALGMTRDAIRRLYLLEAGIMGLVGSILGVLVGYWLVGIGQNLNFIPENFSGSSVLQSKATLVVPVWVVPVALIAGTLIPMLAGYLASRAAANVDPVEAMVQIRAETGQMQPGRWRIMLSIIIVVGLLLARQIVSNDLMLTVMIGNSGVMGAMLVGFLLYAPVLVKLGEYLPAWMEKLGVVGMVAAGNITRRPKRVVVTGMLLLFGILMGMIIGMSNLGYTEFQRMWQNGENIAEITLVGAGANPFQPLLALPAEIVAEIQAHPQVQRVIVEALANFEQDENQFSLRAVDIPTFRAAGGSFTWQAGDEATAYTRLADVEHPGILVGMSFATVQNGYNAGSTLTLDTPSGKVTFTIVGNIMAGISPEAVPMVMDRTIYEHYWGDATIDRMLVQLQPGVDANALRREWLAKYALRGVVAFDNAEMMQAFVQRIASISNVSSLLSNLVVVILIAGIVSTFYVFVLDRRREIGMLRALGFLRRQIIGGLLLEAGLLLALAMLIGIPCAILAIQMQQMAMQNLVGIVFAFNLREVVLVLLFCVVATLASVYLPARSAGRINVLEAMRYE